MLCFFSGLFFCLLVLIFHVLFILCVLFGCFLLVCFHIILPGVQDFSFYGKAGNSFMVIFVASRKKILWIRLAQCLPTSSNLTIVIEVLLITCCHLSMIELMVTCNFFSFSCLLASTCLSGQRWCLYFKKYAHVVITA